ncbi:MAG: hypothetical protein Q7R49_03960 [Candidatus Daviesbacteria bacterium]|nr:hypothetical protein [Candidatus Daviesbacteria bacterium]
MLELGQRIIGIKDALVSLTPQRSAERKMRVALENTAAALSLDIIMEARHFHQVNGLPMDTERQLRLSHYQEEALMTLARNHAIDSDGVRKVYTEMNWPLR